MSDQEAFNNEILFRGYAVINRCDAWYMATKPGFHDAIIYLLNRKHYVVARDKGTLPTLDIVESS
jgi:hypothetical protein